MEVNTQNKRTLKQKIFRIFFVLILLPLLAFAGWLGYTIYNFSSERAALKKDYSEVNNIQYGLLSVDRWRDNITEIVSAQIDEFQLSGTQQDTLKRELNKILNSLISQADSMINEKQKNVGSKLKKFAFKTFVNIDKVRARVPEFSQNIIDQIKRPQSKDRLKFLAQDKLNDFATQTRDSMVEQSNYEKILAKYNTTSLDELNEKINTRSAFLQQNAYNYSFIMIGILVLFLFSWWLVRNASHLHKPMFILSVILALIVLFTGLVAPMIEIDARIQQINFLLVGKHIQFHDQVLFYQSKSIMDVVHILIATGKPDSIFVGVLILVFSILFPVTKLLSTNAVLLGPKKWKNSSIIRFFAFKSGKWSMADVMVVAIFMAYIGFKGILDSQLGNMNVNSNSVSTIATNRTSLQPGFILFITFVLFSLILSVILKRISPRKEAESDRSMVISH